MLITAKTAGFEDIEASSVIIFCPEGNDYRRVVADELDQSTADRLRVVFESGEFEGKLNQTAVIHVAGDMAFDRLVLAGLGPDSEIDHDSYRQAAGTLAGLRALKRSTSVAVRMDDDEDPEMAAAIVEGFLLGGYKFREFMTGHDNDEGRTESLVFFGRNRRRTARLMKSAGRGEIIADGVMTARGLAAYPANRLTPSMFASRAKKLAQAHGFECTVLDEKKIRSEKMGALLAVAQGSKEPARFLILEYQGKRSASKPIVLVGKGVTFDSGGLSLKQPAGMIEMKGDMQGGAIVLAAIVTAARLGLRRRIVGLIPLAENMPSSKAIRPGDIIKSRKGKTIEIINTDAEGRLILADALDYANNFNPEAVIDIATLTGGALYVLGYSGAPVTGNHAGLMDAIREASSATAERVWEMPIWDDFRERMKSPLADLKNSGGKPAATMTAAAFLENFIGDWPWAHIDIAYVDVEPEGRPYIPKGTTGIGLRLLVELLSKWKRL